MPNDFETYMKRRSKERAGWGNLLEGLVKTLKEPKVSEYAPRSLQVLQAIPGAIHQRAKDAVDSLIRFMNNPSRENAPDAMLLASIGLGGGIPGGAPMKSTATLGSIRKPSVGVKGTIKPRDFESISPSPIRAPSDRWAIDPGAIPGEPIMTMKGPGGKRLGIVEETNLKGEVIYKAVSTKGDEAIELGAFKSIDEATLKAERYVTKEPPIEYKFVYEHELVPGQKMRYYEVTSGPQKGSTLSAEALKRQGIVPAEPSVRPEFMTESWQMTRKHLEKLGKDPSSSAVVGTTKVSPSGAKPGGAAWLETRELLKYLQKGGI